MSGGLMQLVAYGAQDAYLTGNPQITFFKVVYRRHTNFAIEAIENTFSGSADFSKRVQCPVVRNGDLISKVYLKVVLPSWDLYPSKIPSNMKAGLVSNQSLNVILGNKNNGINPLTVGNSQNIYNKNWAWVSKLGHSIINNYELTIGGTSIDKHYGDWLNIFYEVARNPNLDRGYN
jgi:hypothetical protein